jgi:hypothetical protein
MKRWIFKLALGIVLASSVGSGAAMAQDGTPPPQRIVPIYAPPDQPVQQYSIVPLSGCDGQSCDLNCQTRGPVAEAFIRHTQATENGILGCMNSKGCGCMATHNTIGCTSCYAEYIFVFGSCREFFGDACVPPPESDRPFGRLLTLIGK